MWTVENEAEYNDLSNRRERHLKNTEYWYDISRYYGRELKGVELDQNSISGDEQKYDNTLGTFISINAKCYIDEEEFNKKIYCVMSQRDCYYYTSTQAILYFEYDNKIFELWLDNGNYELGTGIYTMWVDIYVYDKSNFELNTWALERRRRENYKDKVKPIMEKMTYHLCLGTDLNIITEVVKKVKAEIKGESRNKTNS